MPCDGSFRLSAVTRLRALGDVATRHAALAVGALVILSTAFRLVLALHWDVPWIAPDEMIYGLVGESLWETGELSIRGISTPYYSLLTPALVGLPMQLDDRETGIAFAQALQALAMSLAAVPVYLWGRRLAGTGWGLVAATLTVVPPALSYGGLLVTEALFYTATVLSLFALARVLERPSLEWQGLFLLAVSLAAAVRLQALLLLPVLLVAAGLDGWLARSTATLRRLAPTLVVVGAGTLALVVFSLTGSDLLGAYGELAEATPASSSLLPQLAWHAAAVVILTLGLPLLATATLVVLGVWRGEEDRRVRAFLAVATAYAALLVGQVSLFAADYLDHVSERYLITTLPLLALGLVVWLARGAPRPAVVAVPLAAGAVLLVATVPPERVGTVNAAHDALTVLPLARVLAPVGEELRVLLVVAAIAVAAAFLLLPRRLLPVAAVLLVVAFVGVSVAGAREMDELSALEHAHDIGAAARTWIDDAGAGETLLFDTGEQPATAIPRLMFWNRSIEELARLPDVPEKALPQTRVDIRRDGALTDSNGAEATAPYAVVPSTIALDGELVATAPLTEIAPGLGLWRVNEPLRMISRVGGMTPAGDFRQASVVVYRCGPGALELTLLGKDGAPVIVRVNGLPHDTFEIPAGGVQTISVRPVLAVPGDPCVFELQSLGLVGSTRVVWNPD
jgi:Dolichyl-phosphate-mannose-protein mannosyltransferase